MSIILLSFSLFVLLVCFFVLRDILYARQVASNDKATEVIP
jgi:hypothetical protein